MKINERHLNRIINEGIRKVLKEMNDREIVGGNWWGATYDDYMRRNPWRVVDDDLVRELHTIVQYAEDIFNAAYHNENTRKLQEWKYDFFDRLKNRGDAEKLWIDYLKRANAAIDPIYGLMANRTNRRGDEQAMTMENIKELRPALEELSKLTCIRQPSNAARRLIQKLDSLSEGTKKTVRMNESSLKQFIAESVMRILKEEVYDFSSDEPQYDVHSPEWNENYRKMSDDFYGREKDNAEKMMNQQIRHHFGEKGNAEGAVFNNRKDRPGKKGMAMSSDTIESEVMHNLNSGKSPEEIMNLKVFSPSEARYIKDDCPRWLEPVGAIDKSGKLVFFDTRKNMFVSYDDEREY
jgi:hypothetical protein